MARFLALCCILSFFTIILSQSAAVVAQISGKITVGQSLTATTNSGSSWLSPSGDFAFGFHQHGNSSDLFLLAIWYAKIPDKIVWFANQGYPVPQGSTVRLTVEKGLVLADSLGTQVWSAFGAISIISYGLMKDTGNFALMSSNDSVVWESFKNPTDTLLPTQIMETGVVLNSRLTETNFTKGRFQFYINDKGSLVMSTREIESNYAYDPYFENETYVGSQVVYNESGHMYLLRNNGLTLDLLLNPKSTSEYYHRATMEFDGMLIWYSHPKNSAANGWMAIEMFPDYDICPKIPRDLDSGVCGYNSICSLNNDMRPRCECPSNYSLLDPSNTHGSCKPDFIQDDCDGYSQSTLKDGYKLVSLLNTDWQNDDYAQLGNSSEEECKNSCLNDCFCAAVIVESATVGNCWKKKLPLCHGIQSSSIGRTTWIKVGDFSTQLLNPIPTPKPKTKLNTVLSVLLGISSFVIFVLISAIGYGVLLIYRKKGFKRLDGDQRKNHREYSNVASFSYQELEEATNEFKEEIGRGSFGVVYKGTIGTEGTQMIVAVKKLDRISDSADKEFKTEVKVIGQSHIKNLVQLVGFCKQGDKLLLVYEYMSNGTLADYLFGDLKPSWRARIQVINGVARGLLYLHECSTQIIHCDIKPQNILIDDNHNARISDFGLAKLLVIN